MTNTTQDQTDYLCNIEMKFEGVGEKNLQEFSIKEVILVESLLTPGLQTSISVDSYLHSPVKNFDDFKEKTVNLRIVRPILSQQFKMNDTLEVSNVVYRLQNRRLINNNNENMVFQACHYTLLEDARHLISKPWLCSTPSAVVEEVLSNCAGATELDIESSGPARPYTAENVHPFKIVNDQSDVALAGGTDPSFIHYMTYQKGGTHHFRSLKSLTQQSPIMTFKYSDANENLNDFSSYKNPYSILTYSFPCDFDLLSDLLNGIDTNGKVIAAGIFVNPMSTLASALGFVPGACSIGTTLKTAVTNTNTAESQDSCNTNVENHLLLRQSRMGLLEQDKIALRLTVPWNPNLNVGKVIRIELESKEERDVPLYGSGDYLIHTMTHTIKAGGYSTTTMDCVSTTVGGGIQ